MDQSASRLPGELDAGPSREEKLHALERILASRTFFNAARLQKFLRFVSLKAIDGQTDEVKEYLIGVQVFRKGTDFDPRTDTQVRTEASRLRVRLERYYASEGASDDVLLELPRGRYVPQFSRRRPKSADPETVAAEPLPGKDDAGIATGQRPRLVEWGIGTWKGGLVLAVVALAAYWAGTSLGPHRSPAASQGHTAAPDGSPMALAWSRLIESGTPPLVAFSNSAFLASPQRELYPYTEAGTLPVGTIIPESSLKNRRGEGTRWPSGVPLSFMDSMTGVGEVIAAVNIDRALRRFGITAEIKRGRLVTTDDLHRRDVIFVGSPVVNGVLENLHLSGEFAFVEGPASGPYYGEYISNLHPKPGEKKAYGVDRDPITGAITVEHALVSFLPGISPRRTIVMLAGINTGGTEAAADFATSPASMQELATMLGYTGPKSSKQFPPFFEALLRVEYARGMVLGIRCVTVRVIQPQRSAFFSGASGANAEAESK